MCLLASEKGWVGLGGRGETRARERKKEGEKNRENRKKRDTDHERRGVKEKKINNERV